jgi:putative transposase
MFLTMYTHNREPLLQGKEAKRLVLDKMLETKRQFRLNIAAYVVLDEHVHLLFASPPDNECNAIANHLRAGTQRDLRKTMQMQDDAQIWEHGLKMWGVQGKAELRNHLDFIHYDPVRHGMVERAADYKWSSLPMRVEEGHYPDDWAVLAPPAGVAKVLGVLADPK